MSNYFSTLIIWLSLYIVYAVSLNFTVGYTGFLSLCQATFAGIGSYTVALLLLNTSIGFFPSLVAATLEVLLKS
jgi:branched-chain amino acid transport system permease protein